MKGKELRNTLFELHDLIEELYKYYVPVKTDVYGDINSKYITIMKELTEKGVFEDETLTSAGESSYRTTDAFYRTTKNNKEEN